MTTAEVAELREEARHRLAAYRADELTAEYRRSRGWSAEPGPTTRISLELDRDLVRRLNRQARLSGIPRQTMAAAAIEGIVREFEAVDAKVSSSTHNLPKE